MSCHVECQAVRTVEIKRPGGRDGPQRSFVREVRREEGFGGFGVWLLLLLLRDILGLTWRGVVCVVGGIMGRWEMRRKELGMF